MTRYPVSLIAAVAENGVIGAHNDMPWHVSSDLKYFRRTTTGKPVIMGRRTHQSIGKALPNRFNIVVTRQAEFVAADCAVVHQFDDALEAATAFLDTVTDHEIEREIMVIGGGQLYAAAMPLANRLYITRIEARPDGDTFFPSINSAEFHRVSVDAILQAETDSASCRFEVYERRGATGNGAVDTETQ